MKRLILSVSLCVLTGGVGVASQAETARKADASNGAVRRILENAEMAQHNAHIYQWRRVNREVDRIVASERSLRGSAKMDELHNAIAELRKGRLERDVERIEAAAEQVIKISRSLLGE